MRLSIICLFGLLVILFFDVLLANEKSNILVENIDSLSAESDAVILKDITIFEIEDLSSANYKNKVKILIKNKNAEKYCNVVLSESEFITIEDILAVIKDTSGNLIKKLESDDIKEAEGSFNNFYSGKLYNWFKLTHHSYPYILEFIIEKEYNSLFFWPNWLPQSEIPTIHSAYKLINRNNIEFSYKQIGIDFEPLIKKRENETIYTWELLNIPKRNNEDFLPPENKLQIGVLFKSDKFILGDYKGSTKSWNDYAKFYIDLTKDRYILPQKAKNEINLLVGNVHDEKEKVGILYKHLQNKNRYVAIEMGINGWQPQKAKDVYVNKYGDCKDLSTYMVAMLRHVGIPAYPALALTRTKGKIFKNFPSSQFNHCITVVPFKNDTIWLECTSSYLEMDNMPYTIEDIDVLVIKHNSGEIIHTPQKESSENLSRSLIKGSLARNGDYLFNANFGFSGNRKNYYKPKFEIKNKKDDIIFLKNILDNTYKNITIDNYNIHNSKKENNIFDIEVDGIYNKLTGMRKQRIFINPCIFNSEKVDDLPDEEVGDRKYPIYYYCPFTDIDSVEIELPYSVILESKPKDLVLENNFGKYIARYSYNNKTICYFRYFEIKKNIIEVENYTDYIEFLKKIIKKDKSKMVFKKII